MSDLQTIFPGKSIVIAGEELRVSPFKFGQLPQVMTKAQKIYSGVAHLVSGSTDEAEVILQVMSVGGEDLLDLIGLSINKPRSFFDTIEADDGVALTAAFLEVNLSFFVQKVLPRFKEAVTALQSQAGNLQGAIGASS